ncbi:ferritin-like domain-containing protein [Sphingomonas psychrotolerans]|uniref:Ferritin-like domain-containing protein n=1 Tax=Sphingomonas psychrotolerans TaxID=1327635 RepID=A0ABU3N6K7_9SPHN|nr:ferritin-like domain-containing protein [Sphingomonas psychrotolerans]MDT8760168.1 ferritin-like domain-containing protein [Sphingomonas psychrotolerans]
MATLAPDAVRETFVTGLKNAHALEHQALNLMDRQIEHLANYADVESQLRMHRGETERQIERLETILSGLGESPSTLKDVAMSFSGNMAALAHVFAPDEILKNSFANYAFESFEVASYQALVIMAEEGGFEEALPLLNETLREEQAMQQWVAKTLPVVVRKYLTLRATGETASH